MKLYTSVLVILLSAASNVFSIEIENTLINFGTIEEGIIFEAGNSIFNNNNYDLEVYLRGSCDCVLVSDDVLSIKQNERKVISIKIDTSGYSDKFSENVFVQSNDADKPYVIIDINGYIKKKRKR